ncbi:valine--tRNA ligase [Candidatus Micrarchaeota archaeon]|nr:valine--tRNA ligase [Candidatus Micrarchaeota archaeon]
MLGKLNSKQMEGRWREYWHHHRIHQFDESDAQKPIYVIDTPPPFPTGEFHTGSTLNWGYIDFAARYKRMRQYNVLFPQGWDCHGFPTETKVEKKFGRLPRAEFREKCLEWSRDMVASIKEQMQQMGFSIDWRHEYYTFHKEYHRKVQLSLLLMHDNGLVYQAKHPVLFCTRCRSAIAKAETEDHDREGTLHYVKFSCEEQDLVIATTRPELLHACVGIAVHPEDARNKKWIGKIAFTPLFKKPVRVYADSAVDPEFGSGIVMICTFGDRQDVMWMYQYTLPVVEAFDHAGRVMNASEAYNGLKADKARAKIIDDLGSAGLLLKQEKRRQTVKVHDRCKHPVELLQSRQWFIKLKDQKEKILKASSRMRWYPSHHQQLLVDWTNGLEWDWCISRQRVFGIPLPFYYCEKCGAVHAPSKNDLPVDPASHAFKKKTCSCGGAIIGETSVCDGWVDSSITPLIISKWMEDEKLFKRLYPNAVRPQGTDIIRTWAFYSIFRCTELTGTPPFKDLLINGMVLGSDNKKMSKSLGNYVEAKDVIAKSSVDALRQWIALSGTTGKDNVFYWKDIQYAQSFLNKLWNASSLVAKTLEHSEPRSYGEVKAHLHVSDRWMLSRLHATIESTTQSMDQYEYYDSIVAVQNFFWKDFCDFYLEEVKHRIYAKGKEHAKSREAVQYVFREVLLNTLQLLAPFACYVTEELFHRLFPKEAREAKSIHLTSWPEMKESLRDASAEELAHILHDAVSLIRKFKAANHLALNEPLSSAEVSVPEKLLPRMTELEADLKAVMKLGSVSFKPLSGDGSMVSVHVQP